MDNTITEGQYRNYLIDPVKDRYARIHGTNILITHEHVKEVTVINTYSNNPAINALLGAAIAGTTGAIVGANDKKSIITIRITWNDGKESIAKVTPYYYNLIYFGMTDTHPINEAAILKEENSDNKVYTIASIIGALCFIIYWAVACSAG